MKPLYNLINCAATEGTIPSLDASPSYNKFEGFPESFRLYLVSSNQITAEEIAAKVNKLHLSGVYFHSIELSAIGKLKFLLGRYVMDNLPFNRIERKHLDDELDRSEFEKFLQGMGEDPARINSRMPELQENQ
jgi:hypothetical protein